MKSDTIQKSPAKRISDVLCAHPCLCMLAVCLLSVMLGFGDQANFGAFQAIPVWLAGSAGLFLGRDRLWKSPSELAFMEAAFGILCFWLYGSDAPAQWWILGGVSALLVLAGHLYFRDRLTDRIGGFLLCCMGFCMRFAYVLATPYYVRQHDVGRFDGESGHAPYIIYLLENGQLPDFDVRTVWQFYHPPLHHSIAAGWMRFLQHCGVSFADAAESVQILTLAYSCICMVLFWKLLGHFRLKGAAKLLPMTVVAFHPTFFIMAGSINNDMLSITFLLWAILLTCRWYREQKFTTILQLAIAIGCGMMTKISVWMAAPAAAVVFLAVLIRERQKRLSLIGQYAAFGAVCVPLGLGWGIRNLIRFGVPITYIPMLSNTSSQYVGSIPPLERLLDFSSYQWTYVYDCFTAYGQPYNEFNPTIGILKTAMFDELINPENYPAISGFGELLFLAQFLVVLVTLAAITVVITKRRKTLEHWQLLLTYAITTVSYYSFCLSFAHTCTMNIRYATPLIFIGCLFFGIWMQEDEEAAPTGVLHRILRIPVALFLLGSYLVYACVCK